MTSLAFDHLVLMLRDRLTGLAQEFEKDGYFLTDLAVHNLGSINRLITLDNSYIELLGWPEGAPPARKEIANSPAGLEALVFRSTDARRTYEYLKECGFDVNPVQRLERPIELAGNQVVARFDTVRFSTQPIAGFRVYFCQHLTPEYVWVDRYMKHPNGARTLSDILLVSNQPQSVAQSLAVLTQANVRTDSNGEYEVTLPNTRIRVRHEASAAEARIEAAWVADEHGQSHRFDTRLD
ncbi:hypothetical protein CR155_17190 [Pollutimonas nitritireducens]|uniref:Glyoxalase-like domain-containing protein n=1 Tax=Pollutimonas nitritireducens TaxID=2045209 RepID=A0A2N4UBZ3_9BURK|nr:VOC family protein [Pollutimonas nitritireducens]PLC52529.1 hypothetical protein CR155_17190 [Pollutimonas nitritireducens]